MTSVRKPRKGSRRVDIFGKSPVVSAAELIVLAFVVVFALLPLYQMIIDALRPVDEFGVGGSLLPPFTPTLENLQRAWSELGFDRMMLNSGLLAVTSALLATAFGAMAGFALSHLHVRWRGLVLAGLLVNMAVPPIVILVPVFVTASDLGIVNTVMVGIVGELGLLTAFSSVLIYAYMVDLPKELFEASAVDGARPARQFWHVAIPNAVPSLVSAFVLSLVFAWNDLLIPLILWPTSRLQTLMTGLAFLGPGRTGLQDVPLLMAGVLISALPLVLVYLATRRHLRSGMFRGRMP